MVGVIDELIKSGTHDALEIKKHSDSLVKFIQTTETPITIGVQGEWGSGKTSLLNSIKGDQNKVEELCKIYLDPNYTYDL
jgi:predicted KAP-like P-loop ATPase